jgi:hypothetical protein
MQSNIPMQCTAVLMPNKDRVIVRVAAAGNLSACVDSDGLLWHWGCISEYQEFAVRQPSVMQVGGLSIRIHFVLLVYVC